MYRSLMGIAAVAVLSVAAAPAPANAFAVRHASGVQQDQATIEHVWHRGYPHRRYYRYGYRRAYPYYGAYAYPYSYGYAYRPYYRRHYYYGGPHVQIGPFGFGVW